LYFESDEKGKAVPVEAAELAQLLLTKQVPVCIINACQSAKQLSFYETSLGSNLMEAGIQAVLAVSYSITVSAAKMLMKTVYEHIFSQHSLPKAVSKGRRHLYKQKGRKAYFDQVIDLEDWLLPVVYQNRPVNFNLRDFTPQEEVAYFEKQEHEHTISHKPFYGFFGRDLDIMAIEKRLLNHNMLLLRGMGGTGKTTLLDYLAWWWEKTGFVNKSFYFGYDKTAYTLEQILFVMAKRLFDEQTFAAFQSSGLATQKGKIIDVLKAERFCLIVDNCESITGSPLAVQNTLPDDEQKKLKEFLQKLRGGKSFCVFGSRGDEDWLKKETFKGNVHWLQGLDPEARSDMAMQIVKELSIGFFWDDPAFLRLMALLAGYPLAMEVVLPNLTRLTPAHIIASLRAGDVDLEAHDGKDKTESILKCVDYSHGNLSLDAQKVLLCLAPFSSVVNVALLPRYIEKLQHFEPFKDWPFHLWEEVIQETVKWGLMEPLYQGMFLRLQPVFPFFLRNKVLQTLDDTGREHLDQAFIAHYDEVAGHVYTLFESKKPEERQAAVVLAEQEYENIFTALEMCLERQKSIFYTYLCLSSYIDVTQDHKRGLRLGKMVLKTLEDYPVDLLEGELGVELAGVIDNVGKRFLLTKQLKQAEISYVKALKIVQNVTGLKKEQKAVGIAGIYHQLGMVAEELREFDEARKNYQKALEIFIEFNDQYSLDVVKKSLKRLEEKK
jgi:tetratricopeptide (TPR) repeat protein